MQCALHLLAVMEAHLPVDDPTPLGSHAVLTDFKDSPPAVQPTPVHTCAVLAK